MTRIVGREEIEAALEGVDLIGAIEAGFVDYSEGRSVVPPVGELLLPGGEVHIKYGYLTGDDHYVIKVASGFPGNRSLGRSPNDGMMLVFDRSTGAPAAILLDEGMLTDVRTAAAGAVVAKHLAPPEVRRIGIVGTGVQARLQLDHLAGVTSCRSVVVWGRTAERVERFVSSLRGSGWKVEQVAAAAEVAHSCNLIVTTTASEEPLLRASDIAAGTHITAVGSDTPFKQELDSEILRNADLVVADSIEQCRLRGEIHRAIAAGALDPADVVELGAIAAGRATGRTGPSDVTVADLTGVAVQDIKIAAAVLAAADR